LAARTTDPVLGDFIRASVKPERIISEVQSIRSLIEAGEMIGADQGLEYLKRTIELIESQLNRRYFAAGIASSLGARKGAYARSHGKAKRNDEMVLEYLERLPKSKLSPTALKERIGKSRKLGRSQAAEIIDAGLKKSSG
jgi:hypothetical protein